MTRSVSAKGKLTWKWEDGHYVLMDRSGYVMTETSIRSLLDEFENKTIRLTVEELE